MNASKSKRWRAWAVRRSSAATSGRSPSRLPGAVEHAEAADPVACPAAAARRSAWPRRSRSASSATSPVATDGSGRSTTRCTPGSSAGSWSRSSFGRIPRSGTQLIASSGKRADEPLARAARRAGRGPRGAAAGSRARAASARARRAARRRRPAARRRRGRRRAPAAPVWTRRGDRAVGRRGVRRDRARGAPAGRARRASAASTSSRGEVAPEAVDVLLGRAGEDRRMHALEPLEHPVADRGERGVVDVHQPVEADVRAVVRAELDVHPDRAHRQVAVQPRGHDPPVLRPVGLEQRERVADVAHERAPPHGRIGVLVDRSRRAGRPPAGCRRRRAARPPARRGPFGEHRVDRRREAAREEGGDAAGLQQVHGRPVAAADRAVALEVRDRLRASSRSRLLQWKETKIGRRFSCSGKPKRVVKIACMYQPKQRTQVSSGIGRYIEASRCTVMTSTSASTSWRARSGAHPLAELAEHRGELLAAVQPDAAVADQVAERSDALDVVAEVGRRAVGARVAVVHDRDRAAARRAGAARSASPGRRRPSRAASRAGGAASGQAPGSRATLRVEAGEDGAGELLVAGAEARRRAARTRRAGRSPAGPRPRARAPPPASPPAPPQAPSAPTPPARARRRSPAGRPPARRARARGSRGRTRRSPRRRRRPRASPGARAGARPSRGPCPRRPAASCARARATRDGGVDRRRGRPRRRAAAQPPGDAPGEATPRQPRTTRSLAPCSSVKPSCAAKYSSTARRQPDHL